MTRRLRAALHAVLLLAPALGVLALPARAVTRPDPPRLAPNAVSPLPSYVRRGEPAGGGVRGKGRAPAPAAQRAGGRPRRAGGVFCARRGPGAPRPLSLAPPNPTARRRAGA